VLSAEDDKRRTEAFQKRRVAKVALQAAVDADKQTKSALEDAEQRNKLASALLAGADVRLNEARLRREAAEKAEIQAQCELEYATKDVAQALQQLTTAIQMEGVTTQWKNLAKREYEDAVQQCAEFPGSNEEDGDDGEERKREQQAKVVREREEQERAAREEEQRERTRQEHEKQEKERQEQERKEQERKEREREEREREERLAESIRKLEEIRRQEALEESRRKMAEFQAQEVAREKARKEEEVRKAREQAEALRQARVEEERRKREQEEAARIAREEAVRVSRELRKRKKAREQAAKRERDRCNQRDATNWSPYMFWSTEVALQRFKMLSDEFDTIRFCDQQPLTFESVPWPVLISPFRLHITHIDWQAVEEFFTAVETILPPAQYKELVQKSQRRFHPDRWKSRGLGATMEDEELREQLEAAGNIVSQQVTELWSAMRR
jgi:hypothetical protein